MHSMTRVLVTGATHPTGRNCIRALLHQEDIEIIATDSREEALTRLPFDVPRAILPPPENPEFVDATINFSVRQDIEVILPCLDPIALALSSNKSLFTQSGIFVPVPDYHVARRATDKLTLMLSAESAGIPHPKTICVRSEDDIGRLASLTYPVIAKPRIGYGARGVLMYEHPTSDWSKLKKALKKHDMLVQEYIPGGTGSIYVCGLLYDQQHDVKFAFQSKSTKTQFDFGGPALGGVSVREPTLRAYSEALVRQVGPWVGIALLEFKRHTESGDFYIMDFNPRIWGYSSLADDSGLSFPFASVLVAQNKRFRTHDDYLADVHMERQQLLDQSTYVFSCGRRIDVSRSGSCRATNRRLVALIRDEQRVEAVSSALDDPRIEAVLVLGKPKNENLLNLSGSGRLYFWEPPEYIPAEALAYWAGHLLQATDVEVVEGGITRQHSWRDLRRSWWFGHQGAQFVTREAA
jgi:carbamoylphosphate synthase large subunit